MCAKFTREFISERIGKREVFNEEIKEIIKTLVNNAEEFLLPLLKQKGIKVVEKGNNFGEVVTNADLSMSKATLDSLGVKFPGSFSEEQDSPERMKSLEIYELDPCDGTGDAVKTLENDSPINPTCLLTKLERNNLGDKFSAKSGIVYDVVGRYGFYGDSNEAILFSSSENGLKRIKFKKIKEQWEDGMPVRSNWRESYPQDTAHISFPNFLKDNGVKVFPVRTGGAGRQFLQLLRSAIELENPDDLPVFDELEPIDAIFNAQPDWKTWDTDPAMVIGKHFQFSKPTDIYGRDLEANAANATLKDMWHRNGIIISNNNILANRLARLAREFSKENPGLDLTEKDY